jgi:hypothetical protein
MRKRTSAILLALTALLALLVPAAVASAKAAAKKTPSITRVSPMRVGLNGTITIRGKNFSSRRTRVTVIFRAPDGRTAFVKPTRASSKKLVVKVPSAVIRLFSRSGVKQVPTRFKLRVLFVRFGKFTVKRLSPVIVPPGSSTLGPLGGGSGGSGGSGGVGATDAPGPCGSGSDFDGDLLDNATEGSIGTNPCLKDTDGDGVEDGFEYQSARDLNDDESQNPNSFLPYPGSRPYPNPLDPSDAGADYDRDVLTMAEEQGLWNYSIAHGSTRTLSPLTYSDGEQYSAYTRNGSGHRVPNLAAAGYSKQQDFLNWATGAGYRTVTLSNGAPWYDGSQQSDYLLLDFNRSGGPESTTPQPGYSRSEALYYDFDRDGFLSDNERDEDADGLTNYDELHGRLTQSYWSACYAQESEFPIQYAGTSPTDADSDGDGVRDGADDQDHDDIPNVDELSRNAASGLDDRKPGTACTPAIGLTDSNHPNAYGRVNPFNSCLPAAFSRTCDRHPGFGNAPAPFDGSPDWYSLN